MVAVPITIAGLVAVVVVPFVVFRLYGRRVMGLDEPAEERVHRLRRASAVGLPVLAVAVSALVVVLDVVSLLETPLEAIAPGLADRSPVGLAIVVVAFFGPFALANVSAVLGVLPFDRALRETEVEASTAVRKALLGLCAIFVPIVAWLGLLEGLPTAWRENEVFLAAVFGVFLLVVYAVAPYLAMVFGDTHRLTGPKRDAVESFCRDLGVVPRDVRVVETDGNEVANAMVAGTFPGVTYVFVTDHLLEELSEAELEAIVAHEVGHVVGRHLWYRAGAAILAVGLWIVGFDAVGLGALEDRFGFFGFFLPFLVVFLGYYLLIHGTMAVRQEFAADRYAAERTSADATVSALESLAETNVTKRDVGRLYELLTVHPSIDDRIARIRDEA